MIIFDSNLDNKNIWKKHMEICKKGKLVKIIEGIMIHALARQDIKWYQPAQNV